MESFKLKKSSVGERVAIDQKNKYCITALI